MEILITVTEKEILENPNDSDLGEFIRKKYQEKKIINENLKKSFEEVSKTLNNNH